MNWLGNNYDEHILAWICWREARRTKDECELIWLGVQWLWED
jgi:hypothetical protein